MKRLALVLLVAACGSPAAHDFYATSATPGRSGALISSELVKGMPELHPPAKAYRVLYHSVGAKGGDVAMSGFALVPESPAPAGGRPVYVWGHGTAGLGDQCAPSRRVIDNLPPYGGFLLEKGAVVVAPDYEGLGTPGVAPYAAGVSDGHAVLDAVRSVRTLPGVGALGPVVMAGHSQGGRAVMLAAQVASSYAPELHLAGVVATAPGADLVAIVRRLRDTPAKGGEVLGAIGLAAADPAVSLAEFLTPAALAQVKQVEGECTDDIMKRFAGKADAFRVDPLSSPVVLADLRKASVTSLPKRLPVLVATGLSDDQVPASVVDPLLQRLCRAGATLTVKRYPTNHDGLTEVAGTDIISWLTDRLAGRPTQGGC